MTKPEYKISLRKAIDLMRTEAEELNDYCINHISASDYEEKNRQHRALLVKIESKEQQLKYADSSVQALERSVRINPGVACVR